MLIRLIDRTSVIPSTPSCGVTVSPPPTFGAIDTFRMIPTKSCVSYPPVLSLLKSSVVNTRALGTTDPSAFLSG